MMNPDAMTDEELTTYVQETQAGVLRLSNVLLLVETVLDVDIEEFQEMMCEEDTGVCVLCPEPATFHDVLCIPWCSNHQERGAFVNLMSVRRWQGVSDARFEDEDGNTTRYSIADGAWFTANIALVGSDACVTALACSACERRVA